ncbi:MAG: GvpL/GvpF family gas vesicle protein, partial [Pseudomonadota bacterium]
MVAQAVDHRGRYLYAVVAGADKRNYGASGIDNRAIYTIPEGKISAVVSDLPDKKLRPERRHLTAHHGFLKRLMESETPLPMSFGIIADGTDAVQRILSLNQEAFLTQLHRVEGKVEMGLHVKWDVPNIFEYFVNTHPELRSARDRYFRGHREPSPEDKIELGRMFEHMLSEDRENHTEEVAEILSRCCFEIQRNKCRSEYDVMNLACLVGREKKKEKAFEKGILEAAGMFNNDYAFDYNGPWA